MSRYLLGKVTEMRYRPDIDGLRALSVLSVIFYHLGFAGFKGGYVGVDVFFVISGYLITRNIASDVQKDKFSFANFYLRRARRLFPALFVTIAASLVIGGIILVPYHLLDFAKSLVFTIIPASNVYFWNTAGYFSSEAIVKPLLHMWSLSVEEQFYLVWPSLLIFLFALRSALFSMMILLIAGSFSLAYGEYKLVSAPNSVFFLTQYRVFEFIGGVVCVWLVNHRPKNEIAQEISLAVGLAMIIFCVITYSSSTSFPGLNAVPPVFGAMLVIYAGSPRIFGRLLTNRAVVGVGLISYSLYLVHWPLLVFLTYMLEGIWYVPYVVVIGSLILATLMYKYVETPFRRPDLASITYSAKSFTLSSVILSIVLISISFSAWKSDGWVGRYPPDLRVLTSDVELEKDKRLNLFQEICESRGIENCLNFNNQPGAKNILILGDSHAPDALNALFSINQNPNYVLMGGIGGCPPLAKEDFKLLGPRHPNRLRCIEQNKGLFGVLKKADMIVINVLFQWYKPEHLERAINLVRENSSAPILVFGNYIVLKHDLPYLILKHAKNFQNIPFNQISISKEWLEDSTFMYEAELKELSRKMGFIFLSKKELLCPEGKIEQCPIGLDDGKLFTYDTDHLSNSAAILLGKKLSESYPGLVERLH